jgi:putative transposase
MGRQRQNEVMKGMKSLYHGHRFPAVVIRRVVRWYFRFNLSLRDI